MKDDLGDRMKFYESFETKRRLMPLLPALCRIDGKNFHSFTKNMQKPFDKRLSSLFIETTKFLAKETNACVGYTQSDEISLAWLNTKFNSQILFDGKILKMISVLSSIATEFFNKKYLNFFDEPNNKSAIFDCRVWNVPNKEEAANVFMWREADSYKNSVQMAGRAYFSHNEVTDKNGSEIQEMLFKKKGINWNDYPAFFRRGVYILKRKIFSKFENIDELPAEHAARKNPDLMVERTKYIRYDMPPFGKVANLEGVLFSGEEPQLNA